MIMPIEKMLLTCNSTCSWRSYQTLSLLSMFFASTIRRMLQDPATWTAEMVCVYRRKRGGLTHRIRQQQLSKSHCSSRKFDAKKIANTTWFWWFCKLIFYKTKEITM